MEGQQANIQDIIALVKANPSLATVAMKTVIATSQPSKEEREQEGVQTEKKTKRKRGRPSKKEKEQTGKPSTPSKAKQQKVDGVPKQQDGIQKSEKLCDRFSVKELKENDCVLVRPKSTKDQLWVARVVELVKVEEKTRLVRVAWFEPVHKFKKFPQTLIKKCYQKDTKCERDDLVFTQYRDLIEVETLEGTCTVSKTEKTDRKRDVFRCLVEQKTETTFRPL